MRVLLEITPPIVWVMTKPNDIKENFSALLRDSLRSRYGRIPSAAIVAREFNLRAYDTSPVSQESARRWLRGVSLPEEERLRILVNWLHLDFNKALEMKSSHTVNGHHYPPILNGHAAHERHGIAPNHDTRNTDAKTPSSTSLEHNGFDKESHELIQALMHMNHAQKLALLDLIKLGVNPRPKSR
jgi:hypothetical protein